MKENIKYYQIIDLYKYLINPEKYKGRRPITMRSSWEIKFALFLDRNKNVIEWNSEDVIIQYYNPFDKKIHRYFVDFYVKIIDSNNEIKEYLIEIKPKKKVNIDMNRRISKKMMNEYIINQMKWESAKKLCEDLKRQGRNIEFKILTEEELFNK